MATRHPHLQTRCPPPRPRGRPGAIGGRPWYTKSSSRVFDLLQLFPGGVFRGRKMRSRNACLQSSILLAALAVGLASASMSPAIHPGFSAVLRSRSLERFEPKVAAILLSSRLNLYKHVRVRGGETAGDGYLDRSSSRPTGCRGPAGCRGCELHVILCGRARCHLAPSGARGYIGDAPHLRLAANWTGLCAAGGGFKRGVPGGTRTRAAMT